MIVPYSPARKYDARLRSALPMSRTSVILIDWDAFLQSLAGASCIVPLFADLSRPDARRRARRLQQLRGTAPIVIVTPTPMSGFFSSSLPHRVVATTRMSERLAATVESTVLADRLSGLGQAVVSSGRLPLVARRAVFLVCTSDEPYVTVTSLARDAGRHRTTLARSWRKAFPGDRASAPPLTLRRFVDWVFFLRAVVRKTPDNSWTSVAREMQVPPAKLRRLCRRLAGRGLRGVASNNASRLFRRLERSLAGSLAPSDRIDVFSESATDPTLET